ncbi:hypothetical protein CI102_14358 [Trichoderma harzianum]|nr:hypothetical protein CI102_14358 [Trichoderma harzianum]
MQYRSFDPSCCYSGNTGPSSRGEIRRERDYGFVEGMRFVQHLSWTKSLLLLLLLLFFSFLIILILLKWLLISIYTNL